jgi:membrane protease YdiL (CAAX protease family)
MSAAWDRLEDSVLRIARFAPVRLALLTALLFYLYVSGHMFRASFAHGALQNLGVVLWMAGLTLVLYVGFAHVVERRRASELAVDGMGRQLGLGLLMGAVTYTICVLILMALGIYRIDGTNSPYVLLAALWFAVSSGFFEELFFRGVLMRIGTELFGSWAGLLLSSAAFGLVHLNNPDATWQGAVFIAIEAGLLLGGAYMLTGRLWLGMGWHMAWNFTQSAVFSGINSGNEPSNGLVKATIAGPELLTGGNFGMEASIIAFLLCTATAVIFLVMAVRRGKVVPPFWRRDAAADEAIAPAA